MANPLIDLTFTIKEGMTTFPVHWHPMVEITQMGRLHCECRETRKLVIGTHTGTHMDAPRHFIKSGKTIDQLDLELFVGEALLLDFTKFPRFYEISKAEMAKALGKNKPKRLVLRYDWSEQFETPHYYSDHPFLSEEASQHLVDIGVKLVGMDTPMPDNPKNGRGAEKDSPNHKILLGNDVLLVEYLTNLKALGATKKIDFMVFPLKVKRGDGAPVRALARAL